MIQIVAASTPYSAHKIRDGDFHELIDKSSSRPATVVASLCHFSRAGCHRSSRTHCVLVGAVDIVARGGNRHDQFRLVLYRRLLSRAGPPLFVQRSKSLQVAGPILRHGPRHSADSVQSDTSHTSCRDEFREGL